MQHRHVRRAAVMAAVAAVLAAAPAHAASPEPDVDRRVGDFLAEHPDAEQVAPHQVAWDGGDVVMTFPSSAGAHALRGQDGGERLASAGACGPGWSCLYEDPWYGGRMLQFRSCGYTQSLGSYGFANRATSWVNNRGSWTRVFDGGSVLWTEYGYAQVGHVGSAANDRADSIHLLC